jgi:hypothetical protein
MINFGITLQDRPNELPLEVALWLLERNEKYPDVQFKVDFFDIGGMPDGYPEKHEALRLQFSQLIHMRANNDPLTVVFMYPGQNWSMRIIGNLTPEERREIAQIPEDVVEIPRDEPGNPTMGVPFRSDERPVEDIEFVPVEPDMHMTGFAVSAAEFQDIVLGERTERKEAIMQAMSEKNWEKAKGLLKQRN